MSAHLDRVTAALADHYRIERELGEGGMATVFLARDLKHDRDVAIKVVHPDLGAALGGERFLSEIRTTARLQHPHILPLLDSGAADGLLYYVMPLVTGETLRVRLERERQLPIADALRIAREVAGALDHAHRQGVIHRDIKPENILLQDGAAVVADFGIALALQTAGGARMTQTGLSLGTPQYMSPEQAMGERAIDARSDIYSLGVVTYEMLAGDPPFTGSTVQALVARVMSERPTSLRTIRDTVPASVDEAVHTALAKLPADRHASAAAFAEALSRVSTTTQAARTNDTTTPASSAPPRSRITSAIGAVAALALAAAGGAWFAKSAPAEATPSFRATRLTYGADVGCASISPNGDRFAAVVGTFDYETYFRGDLVIRPYPTGTDVVIARGVRNVNAIMWSPDESGLLISGIPEGKQNGVYYFNTRTGAVRQLHGQPTADEGFVDARHVYYRSFGSSDKIHIVDVESGDVQDSLPYNGLTRHAFSPSGARVAFATDHGTFITDRHGAVIDSMPVSGGAIAWAGDTALVIAAGDLMALGVDARSGKFSGTPRPLVLGLSASVRNLAVSRDGRRITMVLDPITDELAVVDLPRAQTARVIVRSLNGFLGSAQFSPNGRRVVYPRQDPLGTNVYAFDLEHGTELTIISDTVGSGTVGWLNDQRVTRQAGDRSIYLQDLETGRARQVRPKRELLLQVAAGGTWVFADTTLDGLVLTDSLMRDPHTIDRPTVGGTVFYPVLSADGRTLARLMQREDKTMAYGVYDVPTRKWSPLVSVDTMRREPATLTSSGTLYATNYNIAQARTVLWRATVGSQFSVYATLPLHCEGGTVAVSEDGSRAVCNRRTHLPDVWTVDLRAGRP